MGRNRYFLPSDTPDSKVLRSAISGDHARYVNAGGKLDGRYPNLSTQNSAGDRFLTTDELAEMLRIKKSTIYDMVSNRRIPFRKAGHRTIFLLSEIMEWTSQEREDTIPAPFEKRLQTGKGSR
jgi:excisionase family DNA binding protein